MGLHTSSTVLDEMNIICWRRAFKVDKETHCRTYCFPPNLTHNDVKDTIQNFQFSSVRTRTYSSNISLILLARWRDTGAPVAGSIAWQLL